MKTAIFALIASTLFVGCTTKETASPCSGDCHTSTATAESPTPNTAVSNAATSQALKPVSVQNASTTSGISKYNVSGVNLVASSNWEEVSPQSSQVALQLTNSFQGLTFTVVNTTSRVSFKEYLTQGVTDFKSQDLNVTTSEINLNGSKYTTLTVSGAGSNTIQLIHADGTSITVLSCNGDSFDDSDSDACQSVFSTVRFQ